MKDLLKITKALSDESRVRILLALLAHELCLCQIIDLLGLAPSTVSKHVSVLMDAGLITSRKDGKWRYYSIKSNDIGLEAKEALDFIRKTASSTSMARKDMKRIAEILRKNKEDLCRHYKREP